MTRQKFEQALIPKAAGVWNLFLLTRNMNLDIFIMYSSMSSMYGNPGQTNYGAGNGFKDAVSCMRRSVLGVGQSICFSAMDLGIISDQPLAKKKLLAIGLSPLKVPEITACLDHALITDMPLVGYGKFIWKLFYRTSILLPGIQKQYEPLVRRFCHHLSVQHTPTRGLQTSGNSVSSYVIEVLKTVALLNGATLSP